MTNKKFLGGFGLAALLFISPLASARLAVINVDRSVTSEDLKNYFSQYGKVSHATVMIDHETGQSRGLGFIELEDKNLEDSVIEQTTGKHFAGRTIRVEKAKDSNSPDTTPRRPQRKAY